MWFTMMVRRIALAAVLMLGSAASGIAQTAEADDPPGRIGRLSYMEGTVSFRNLDDDQWVPATINFPVTTGNAFWTEPQGRAEIQIGSADLRLDQTTAIQVVRLDDAATQIQIDEGAINFRLRDLPPGGVRLVTPRAAVDLLQPGRYHIDVAPPRDGQPGDHVRIAVLDGAARIDGLAAPLTVTTGHSATIGEGETHPLLAQAVELPLDTWALERDRALDPQQTARYVSPEMTGHRDLDRHGQWTTDPTYGAVWYPSATVVDWAPYRYGHWAYVQPWGWTWIDHQPWGFAPFHYGRWVRIHDRWGWCPGRRIARPVYAPHLVAFVGGSSFSVAVYSGRRAPAVGWVPLSPHDVYRPHHRHSTTYVRNVNITHINVTNIRTGRDRDHDRDSIRSYRNRDGMTVVSSDAFTGAAPVDKARMQVRDRDIDNARTADSLDHLRPSRASKAGLLVPAVATSGSPATSNVDAGRSRRSDRGGDHVAPPTETRRATAATQPARDPDILPRAPGPNRERRAEPRRDSETSPERQIGNARPSDIQKRVPAASPLDRQDRAAPALRTPESATVAPTATPTPNGGNPRVTPPGRAPGGALGSAANPPGRQPIPAAPGARDNREREDTGREDRRRRGTDQVRTDPPRAAPRPLAPEQTPGRAPNTVAPARPAPVSPAPTIQPNAQQSRPAAPPAARPSEPPRDAQRGSTPPDRPERSDKRREAPRTGAPSRTPGNGANAMPPRQEPTTMRQPTSPPAPARQTREREAVPRSAPAATPQRVEPQRQMRQEPRTEARRESRADTPREARQAPRFEQQREMRQPEPRREARPQPQPSAPRDMTPRRVEQPARPQPQEAQRSGNGRGRSEEWKRNGG